jgi:hypothetical protein
MIEQHRSVFDLRYEFGPARSISKDMPELAIGYDESFVVELLNRNQLEIARPIYYGSWVLVRCILFFCLPGLNAI